MSHRMIVLLAVAASLGGGRTVRGQSPRELAGFDAYVETSMRAWSIPGVAIAVVRGDSLIYARGFGVKRLGDTARVGPETMFAIGSISKSFTALGLGLLVDEKRIGWDDPVVSRLPGFQLADPDVTRGTTIRDLLSHRTGLPGENLLFWGTDVSRAEVIRRMRYLPLRTPPRTTFEYQNLGFVAAGEVIGAVTGTSWDDFITERVLLPLGMTRATTRVAGLARFTDVASPHGVVDGRVAPIAWLDLDNAGPAGSIVASALDMARYASLQLGHGEHRGRRIFSDSVAAQMHEGSTIVGALGPLAALFPEAHLVEYGLGWFRQDYHGQLVVSHGGQTNGMHANLAIIPEERLGIVVLTNSVVFGYPGAITLRIIDAFRGRPLRDWSTEFRTRIGGPGGPAEEPARVTGTTPSIPAAALAGRYHQDYLGDATVASQDGVLTLRLLGREVRLEHWHFDTYRARWAEPMTNALLPLVTFERNGEGAVARLRFDRAGAFDRAR